MSVFDSFLEVAGNLGFLVGNNDRRRAQARKENRSWGVERDGFAVSIAASSLEPQADDSLRIEVALRNTGAEAKSLKVGSWLSFFSLSILKPDGSEARLSNFGKRQTEAADAAPTHDVMLEPDQVIEADLPVGALYEFRQRGVYQVVGSCQATGAISNTLDIRI